MSGLFAVPEIIALAWDPTAHLGRARPPCGSRVAFAADRRSMPMSGPDASIPLRGAITRFSQALPLVAVAAIARGAWRGRGVVVPPG